MEVLRGYFDAMNAWLMGLFSAIGTWFVSWCEKYAYPPLSKFFLPINDFLAPIYQPWASIIAIGLFIGAMIWVGFILKESYVNMGRPHIAWYTDLRIWTAVSMLPHVFVYFYFI